MSNTRTNRSPLDALSGILERLHGTAAQVTKLRQFLGDLESELNEICQECENEINAHTPAVSDTNQDLIAINQKRNRDVMKQTAHTLIPARPGLVSIQGQERNQGLIPMGQERRDLSGWEDTYLKMPVMVLKSAPKSNPRKSEPKGRSAPSFPGDPSLSVVSRSSKLSSGHRGKGRNWLGFMAVLRSWSRTAAVPKYDVEIPSVPQPPHLSPFPGHIDPSCYPSELKREGGDWFVLFNPSPKVKRALDINLVHTLPPGSGAFCVRFSRDGKWLATGCDGSAQVYYMKTGVRVCFFDHTSSVRIQSMCFSPDGQYLATGASDTQVRVWNIANKQCEYILEGHENVVYSVDFSPNGQFIVSGSSDRTVRIWDVHDWTFKVLTLDDHYQPAIDSLGFKVSAAISPDGRYVAAGGRDNVVGIWEMTTGVLVQRLRGHLDYILSVAFTPDGKGLISGGSDRILKYWDVSRLGAGNALPASNSSSPCLMNLPCHTLAIPTIYSTAVSHHGTSVVSGSDDGKLLFWDMRTGVVQFMLSVYKDSIYGVHLSPTGNLLATAGWNGKVRIWSYGVFR